MLLGDATKAQEKLGWKPKTGPRGADQDDGGRRHAAREEGMTCSIPVILSGGAGTRLWPVSREGHPKPFMKLPDGQSLLQKTYQRAAARWPRTAI